MIVYSQEAKNILMWGRIGAITCHIAKKLGIKPLQALKDFYRSNTCRRFHDRRTGLYLYSDLYIVDSFLEEKGESDI